ncbi:MAG: GWxTD domain-containing protein [Acidobacteria bacterium]|nr:MAG: GWxTD domain-containing protein [Acidobacteriota bacterium]
MISRLSFILLFVLAANAPAQNPSPKDKLKALKQEESRDYFQKWLNEDALYLITDDERAVFEKLTTTEEKEQFVEQFWHRRDPDIRTPVNELKEEHYRRIAYANEWYTSATPGWKTDRGRIYIIHGPPDQVERHPAGGPYIRPPEEGGGTTTVYPFEKWWYRHMEGLGAVELEFVDPSSTGEYRLALNPYEKDAMRYVPGAGLTESELRGDTTKADRPYYFPGNYENRLNYYMGSENDPFRQWEKFVVSQKPRPIQYPDLKEVVNVNVTYTNLPFKIRADYFRLDENQVVVPITVEVANSDLSFKQEEARHSAKVAFYGIVTSLANRVVAEFDDDMISSFSAEKLEQGQRMGSIYQKILLLNTGTRYKLDFIVKDLNSGKVGVVRQGLVPPTFGKTKMLASSLLLADVIIPLTEAAQMEQRFVLGNVKVRPSVDKSFVQKNPVGLYLQAYNVAIDQATNAPSLRVSYRVIRDGKSISEVVDDTGESLQYFSGERAVLIRALPTDDLEPGRYQINVEVKDRIGGQSVTASDEFRIVAREVAKN